MKVIICGAGRVGASIAQRLSLEKHHVSVIDNVQSLVQNVSDTLDVQSFFGHGSDPEVLQRAGAEDADMLIAVTLHDEVNMVACQVAHSLFKVPTKMARIRSDGYLRAHWRDLFSRQNIPIDVLISPEQEVGDVVLRRLGLPGAFDVLSFCSGQVSVIGVACEEDCPVVGTPLSQLSSAFPELKAVIVGIARGDTLFVPGRDDRMLVGDEVYVVSASDQVQRTLSIFGHNEKEAHRVIVSGGGGVGLRVACLLEERGVQIRVIEESREQAIRIANSLPSTIVLHGSTLDDEILREANVEQTDTLLALTNDDQVNIMASVMAKNLGCKRAMVLVSNPSYSSVLHSLGIDSHIDPRAATISKILRHMRLGRILSVSSIRDGRAEVLEAECLDTSPLLGKVLGELPIPGGLRIGAILRGDQVMIPDDETRIEIHDRIVVFSMASEIRHVEQMFRVRFEFF